MKIFFSISEKVAVIERDALFSCVCPANGSISQNRCKKRRVRQTSWAGVQVLAALPSPTLGVNLSEARERKVCSDQSPLHLESGLRGRSQPSPACAGGGQRSWRRTEMGNAAPRQLCQPGSAPTGEPRRPWLILGWGDWGNVV